MQSRSIEHSRSLAISFCSSLTSITIPNSVVSIGENSFYRCEKLKFLGLSIQIAHIAFRRIIDEGTIVQRINLVAINQQLVVQTALGYAALQSKEPTP